MGEYAYHLNRQIKIGTCDDMLYLRWEDRGKVQLSRGSVDPVTTHGLRFRLPFPDEDGILPGGYDDAFRGQRLFNHAGEWPGLPEMADAPGVMQIWHQASGILINLPCHHGIRLPDLGPNTKVFWNGKGHALEMTSVKTMEDGSVVPIVTCRHCRESWRMTWEEVWDWIPEPLRKRLAVHRQASCVAGVA